MNRITTIFKKNNNNNIPNNNKGYELVKNLLSDQDRFKYYASQKFKQVIDNEATRSIDPDFQFTMAESLTNRHLNRYSNIIPYNSNCMKLTDTRFGGPDDYINASWILAPYNIPKFYIATQGPIPTTLYDFWRMVVEKDVPVIVCLTPEVENHIIKCGRYWPINDQEQLTLKGSSGHYAIISTIKASRTDTESNCIVRTLLVEVYNQDDILQASKRVTQLHFLGWPDHGAPQQTQHVIALIKLTRQFEEDNKPVLVHCSAGCGRTGTFCVVDTAEYMLHHDTNVLIDPIFLLTDHFRKQRTTMVQALAQYNFCYLALKNFMDNK